ncbi:MAG: AAA family ATPase [Chloracidobacterium sp.]|nr:AAA family ATPase [Chloracidobacterium sp.]
MNTKHTLQYAEEPDLEGLVVVKKFNEWMAQVCSVPVSKLLFGQLWIEGEIAVLTGDPGAGKSLLAVQIAEAVARGKGYAGKITPEGVTLNDELACTSAAQKVLYINLKQSSKQFAMRYAEEHDPEDGETLKNPYKFSKNLHRVDIDIHCKVPDGYKTFDEILPLLVEKLAHKYKAKVVIIDSITYLHRSVYGYRETYAMMKGLHRIKTKRGISILVLARSSKYGSVRESAAGSCSALFSRFADSVFKLGTSRLDPSARYLKQMIVHSSEKIFDESRVASLMLKRLGGNFLGFEHYGYHAENDHKHQTSDDRLWPAIDKVKRLSDEGKSIREIAAELDIPRTTVHRYLQMWNKEIGAAMKRETFVREQYDPTKDKNHFPGHEEYDEAKNHPKFGLLYDPSIPDNDPQYRLLMREYGLIDNASYRASKAYEKTGITPKLIEDKQYAEFIKDVYDVGQFPPEIDADDADNEKDKDKDKDHSSSASSGSSAVNERHSRKGWPTVNEKGVPIDLTKLPQGVKHSLNAFDHDIWIETEDEYTGKPAIWYSFDSKGRLKKHVRDSLGVKSILIDKPDGPRNGIIWVDEDENDREEVD